MYLTIDRATVAIDATTCRERWTLQLGAQGGRALADQPRRGDQGRTPRARHRRWLPDRPGHGQGHAALEPEDRRCQDQPVPEHAAADLRGSGDLRAGRGGLGSEELDRRLQARRLASRSGASISFPMRANPERTPGPIQAAREHGGGSLWTPFSLDVKTGRALRSGRQPLAGLLPGRASRNQSIYQLGGRASTSGPASSSGTANSVRTMPTTGT